MSGGETRSRFRRSNAARRSFRLGGADLLAFISRPAAHVACSFAFRLRVVRILFLCLSAFLSGNEVAGALRAPIWSIARRLREDRKRRR
jgi:hypothetical protein